MQSLSLATKAGVAEHCASLLLEAVPPVNWFIRRKMRAHRRGLSVPQFRTLVLIEKEPEASLSLVADFLGSSLPTASRIVGGLVKKGFIQRRGCINDRRQLSLMLSSRGESVLNAAFEQTRGDLAAEVGPFTAQERAIVSAAMEILKTRFGSMISPRAIADENHRPAEAPSRRRKLRIAVRA